MVGLIKGLAIRHAGNKEANVRRQMTDRRYGAGFDSISKEVRFTWLSRLLDGDSEGRGSEGAEEMKVQHTSEQV